MRRPHGFRHSLEDNSTDGVHVRFLSTLLILISINGHSVAQPGEGRTYGVVAFGDSGYHLDHPDPRDGDRDLYASADALRLEFRKDWIEDGKSLDDLIYPPVVYHADEGGYAIETGLHAVAAAMESTCQSAQCDFGLMLGDNIYPVGAVGDERDKALFQEVLVDPFSSLAADEPNFKIYAVLGNHDWKVSHAGAMAQVTFLEEHPLFHMDGTVYRAVPKGAEGFVEIFAIDTEILLANANVLDDKLDETGTPIVHDEPKDYPRWIKPTTDREKEMVNWLEAALADSDAHWKIVIGHNPLWSSAGGKFEQARELRRLILPILCRYADFYIAGHDHTLEVHEDTCGSVDESLKPLPALVSGAAAKLRGLNAAFMAHQDKTSPDKVTHYAEGMVWGFAHLALSETEATVRVFTTPLDGSGVPELAHRHAFPNRTGG